jgi:hypothetical protein
MQKNVRKVQLCLNGLFAQLCPSKDSTKDDNKKAQLHFVLGDFLGLKQGESLFTDNPIFGSDCCNNQRATIFPCNIHESGHLGDLAASQNQVALDFHRALGEYPDITSTLLLFFR